MLACVDRTNKAPLDLHPHALALFVELPVREIVTAVNIIVGITLGLGVVHDYLK